MKLDQKFTGARGEITHVGTIDPANFFQDTDTGIQELLDTHARERVVEMLGWSIAECAWSLELGADGATTIIGHLETLAIPGKWQNDDPYVELRVPFSRIIENEIYFAHEGRMYGPESIRGALGKSERLALEALALRLRDLAAMVDQGLADIDAATSPGEPNP